MKNYNGESWWVKIYIAGDLKTIEQTCRQFALKGGCYNITPNNYVYTYGEETGAIIELINYPKYPSNASGLWGEAESLANALMSNCFAGSYTIMDPEKVITYDRRD